MLLRLAFSVVTYGGSVAVVVLKWTPVKSFLISHLSIGRMSSPLLGLQTPHLDALSKEYKQTLHYFLLDIT